MTFITKLICCHVKVRTCHSKYRYRSSPSRRVQNEVARTLNVNQSTISRLWNRFQQTGSTNDCQRSGRPRITTPGQDRYIRVFHLWNQTVAASTTAAGIPRLRRFSSQTVRNRLRQHGIRPRRSYFGAVLMPLHRRERVR